MEGQKTQWGSIILASIILFLVSVQFSIYFASLWPYLSQIDSTATQTFYGFVLAAYSFGQMIAAPVFGYWNSKIKRVTLVITVGVCFSIAGNLLYIFTEAAPSNRKWLIFWGRFLCGIASGIIGTVRGYIATASMPADQNRAVSLGSIGFSLGIAGGPCLQFIMTPLGTGFSAGPLHLNEYTAAAYLSLVAALVLLILLFTIFKENYIGVDMRKAVDPYHYVPKPDMTAAILLMLCWFSAYFMTTVTDTVESPYTMANFNWTNSDAVYYNSIIMTVSSGISSVIYVGFAIFGKRINQRISITLGLLSQFGFYVFTFSWWFYTGRLDFKSTAHDSTQNDLNTTFSSPKKESVGCDAEMEWCNYTPRLPMPVYLAAYPFFSIGLPLSTVSVATLYASVLGPRRQGFMQSLMAMSGSTARALGPILISWLFVNYGPRIAWLLTSIILAIPIFCVLIFYHRLVPHKMRPQLHSGQKLRYDGGTLYRF